MHNQYFSLLCGAVLLLGLIVPAACAPTPLWVEPATVGGDLSGVVISPDGSTIVVGGDQLISLTRDGRKRWSGWSGSCLEISREGDYILSSQGPVVRLISSAGTLLWEQSMEIAVTDISIAHNSSMIAASGGGRLRTMTLAGEGIASNTTLTVNHIRIMPSGQVLVTTKNDVQLLNPKLLSDWSDTNSSQDLIAVSADGSTFVTATNNRIRMYKGNGNLTWDRKLTGENAQALAYSGDGSTIVIGTDHNNIIVMSHAGANLWSANATNWITSVAVSNDGNTIVAGGMDKKLFMFNRVGTLLGSYPLRNPIKSKSVAVTGDGQLIVAVDETAVYAFSRSSLSGETPAAESTNGSITETTEETTTMPLTETVARRATRTPALPTPYPVESETPDAPLPLVIPLLALGFLQFFRLCHKK